ncbi:hypothetical protein [Streptomyces indicus]|uniref:Uncharacterized protein n=1 Tax=Streptomyces indicus TaxID=417292 RepID=A0A1G9EHM7_9ACTN|nr:hypothetical protein [Streptomyces indicus]SDK75535.1 hypothetical protein SAMN05421806_111172 [Streptomyces indicus]
MGEDQEARRRRVEEELRLLQGRMTLPGVDGRTMAERVLAQIVAEQVPTPVAQPPSRRERLRGWLRVRRARTAAALTGLLIVAVLTPPVRAAVADWFDFGGVEVRHDPSASLPPPSPVPGCGQGLSVEEAEREAGFEAVLPRQLSGRPTAAVSGDRRVLSLCWRASDGSVIRLDQFKATIDPVFWKTTRVPYEPVTVRGSGEGLWFDEPHKLRIDLLDAARNPYSTTVRSAGPTLLWEKTDTGTPLTLRLEGIDLRDRALEVAASVE